MLSFVQPDRLLCQLSCRCLSWRLVGAKPFSAGISFRRGTWVPPPTAIPLIAVSRIRLAVPGGRSALAAGAHVHDVVALFRVHDALTFVK